MEPGRLHRKRWPPSIGTRGRVQSDCLAAIVGIRRLEDQKLLADPNFVRTVKRWERREGGGEGARRKTVADNSKWWQPDQSGGYVMTVKVGSKRIEFEKGKAAIAVGTLEKLPGVIEALIKAVRAGELDEQLKHIEQIRKAYTCTQGRLTFVYRMQAQIPLLPNRRTICAFLIQQSTDAR